MQKCFGSYRAILPADWPVVRVAAGHACPEIEEWLQTANIASQWVWRTVSGVIEFAFAESRDAVLFATVWK